MQSFETRLRIIFLALAWRDEIEIIIRPFLYFEMRARFHFVTLMFRDEIETSENHFSWSSEKKWSWLSSRIPGIENSRWPLVWGAKAGSRGHVEEDCRLHRLWLDRRGDSGRCSLQQTYVRLDFFTWQWHFLETERAHEVWQLPEVQLIECKGSILVRNLKKTLLMLEKYNFLQDTLFLNCAIGRATVSSLERGSLATGWIISHLSWTRFS